MRGGRQSDLGPDTPGSGTRLGVNVIVDSGEKRGSISGALSAFKSESFEDLVVVVVVVAAVPATFSLWLIDEWEGCRGNGSSGSEVVIRHAHIVWGREMSNSQSASALEQTV